eukprot:scaffold85_cov145-Alexandrium_tamarense.AAC.47
MHVRHTAVSQWRRFAVIVGDYSTNRCVIIFISWCVAESKCCRSPCEECTDGRQRRTTGGWLLLKKLELSRLHEGTREPSSKRLLSRSCSLYALSYSPYNEDD